jgi:hypothetical protein
VLRVLLLFGVLWWMFGGYVWLTNAVAPDRPIRKLLLLAAHRPRSWRRCSPCS